MRCATCGHPNREGAKFCDECGASLEGVKGSEVRELADSHSTPIPNPVTPSPLSYTPRHLAEKILTLRSAIEGERKQVTVLFADIQGSMELAERIGAEEWHGFLDRFFRILTEGIHRFEGTVNQYTGDGIMALFGAPIAYEDHAQRACHAALRLRERLRAFGEELRGRRGFGFSFRMGLSSGEVVVGKIGDDLRMDYTAQGHTVGLAQRVEQLAAADAAYLVEATARLVADYFRLRDLGEFRLKGASEPVRIYELEGPGRVRSRVDVVQARSRSRFVGRRSELEVLERAVVEAVDGRGQVIGLVGEPGVGKTRLCLELVRRCRKHGVVVARAHCPAHVETVPLLPILDLLRSWLGVREEDSPEASRKKIRRRLTRLSPSLDDALPLVFDFLGIPDPAAPVLLLEEQRRTRLAAFLGRLLQTQSAAQPLMLFVDDLHCIDPESDAYLAAVVEALGWTHTLLLVNFRSGHRSEWMKASYYREVELAALPDRQVDRLLRALIGDDPSTADLRHLIRERTDGNPFFVEEVVQSLVDRGALRREDVAPGGSSAPPAMRLVEPIEDISIPATVQALLAARMDRLSERDKRVLQAASVIGRSFSSEVLGHVFPQEAASPDATEEAVSASLGALERGDFVRREGSEPDCDYTFKHPLTHAVAYGSQLAQSRARLHVATARALQSLYPDRLGRYAALLAHHFAAADWKFEAARWRRRAALRVTSIELSGKRKGTEGQRR